jgi:hypothetical protein
MDLIWKFDLSGMKCKKIEFFVIWRHSSERIVLFLEWKKRFRYTDVPHYFRTFYLQICLFTLTKMAQNDNFPVKNDLFICEFNIRGPKWRNVSTANNEGNLYSLFRRGCVWTSQDHDSEVCYLVKYFIFYQTIHTRGNK